MNNGRGEPEAVVKPAAPLRRRAQPKPKGEMTMDRQEYLERCEEQFREHWDNGYDERREKFLEGCEEDFEETDEAERGVTLQKYLEMCEHDFELLDETWYEARLADHLAECEEALDEEEAGV